MLAWAVAAGSVLAITAVAAAAVVFLRPGQQSSSSNNSSNSNLIGTASGTGVDPGTTIPSKPAPGFALTNQSGQPTSLAQFRGKVVLLGFVDSQCTTICPLTTTAMLEAKQMLGPAAADVALLAVNANPQATTVADVRAYTQAHAMTNQWQFLTGSPSQLAAVWHAYNVYAAITSSGIDHEPVIYLIDQQGREREIYITQMAYGAVRSQAAVIARAAARLLPGHPRVHPAAQAVPVPPTQRIELPSATGGAAVAFGPGHPHLVVFFDTWLSEVSNLPAELEALNGYAAQAKAKGWPSLVAVDVAPVEAGPTALAGLLHALPAPLAYPVVVDTTGALADGYQVQAEPWYALTSASGKILLTNTGTFPVPALEAAVAKAERTG